MLGQLGVPQAKLLEDIVRQFDLNDKYIEEAKKASDALEQGSASRAAGAETIAPEPTTDAQGLANELLTGQRAVPLPMA